MRKAGMWREILERWVILRMIFCIVRNTIESTQRENRQPYKSFSDVRINPAEGFSRKVDPMTTRSRLLYVLVMLAGLGITLNSMIGLSSYDDRTPLGHVIPIAVGLLLVGLGGYISLRPERATSSTSVLLAAIGSFLVVIVLAFSLLHLYGITGLFSTGDSTRGFSFTVLWLVVSVWMVFYYFSLRRKEPK
jgi:hypothetical protein